MKKYYDHKPTGLGSKNSNMEAWRFATIVLELWSTAVMIIVMRYWEFTFGWPTRNRQLNDEGKRMINEKIYAGVEANTTWLGLVLSPYLWLVNPWGAGQALMFPYYHRTKANARRLTHRISR
jgi:hypothetical protein